MFDSSEDLDHLSDLVGGQRLVEITGEEADVLASCASASIRVNAHDDALAILRAALVIDPEHPRAWALTGHALEQLGRLEEATSAYATALLYDDRDPITALALARLHLEADRVAKARALIEWVIARFPDAKHTRQRALHLLERAQRTA